MVKNRRAWLDEVVGQIRFVPDRKAVFEELTAHIQDRSDDLASRGYTREEAEARTLLAMGDPIEVGKQLDAVHKPWLGWLWKVSRWLVFLAIAAVAICWFNYGGDPFSAWTGESTFEQQVAWNTEKFGLRYAVESDAQTEWRRYTFRVTDVVRYRDYDKLSFRLVIDGFLPWEECLRLDEMYAVDSLGNRYDNMASMYYNYLPNAYTTRDYLSIATANDRIFFSWEYDGTIECIDPAAEWFELRHERAGQIIVLRVDLPGGEGQ